MKRTPQNKNESSEVWERHIKDSKDVVPNDVSIKENPRSSKHEIIAPKTK